jgi:glucose-1-phosphate cytidylyltransferase
MKVVILCGGLGTRLREETEARPKPMVLIGGRPILWHIMKIFAHHGFKEFVLCLGYRGDIIREYFLNYRAMNNDFTVRIDRQNTIQYHDTVEEEGYQITLAETGLNTMTGGRIKRVARYLEGEDFVVTYGDGVTDLNVRALVDFHLSHGKLATVTTVPPISRFGVVSMESDCRVTRFQEKIPLEASINAGFFVFKRGMVDHLENDATILEQAPLQRLAESGQLMAYRHKGPLYAMDTYRDYLFLNELWEKGKASWKVW